MWFEIPGKPVPTQRVRVVKGHAYTPDKTKAFEELVGEKFKESHGKKLAGPVWISITVWYQIPPSWTKKRKEEELLKPHTQKPDLDNVVKSILDGLNGKAWADDAQVARITASKYWTDEPTRTVVIVEEA